MIGAGLVGMAIGFVPDTGLKAASADGACRRPLCVSTGFLSAARGPLRGPAARDACLRTLLYAAGSRVDPRRWLPEQTLLLGRYSLMAYIVQIFYLQLFKRSPLYGEFEAPGAVVVIVSTAILTWGTVLMVDRARQRNTLVDRAYRLIFA